MIRDLEQDSRFVLRRSRLGDQQPRAKVEDALAAFPGLLVPSLVDFYCEINGMEWRWQVDSADVSPKPILGMCYIPPVEQLSESVSAVAGGFRMAVDVFVAEASVVLFQPGEASAAELRFCVEGEPELSLRIGVEAYLAALCESRGFFYWMQALCPECQMNREVSRFRELAPKLFPDIDLSLFEVRTT